MDLRLKGKKALILGGTRGIGRAIADTLAAEGVDVGVCARNAQQVAEAVDAMKAKGVQATGGALDITDAPALKQWVAEAAGALGGLDILISNAGAMAQGNDPGSWDKNFQLDVMGAVNAFDAARPYLEKAAEANGDAAFIIISSVSAAETDMAGAYGPIKAALIHHAKGLAREHAKRGIRVNVVSPGTVYFKDGIWNTIEQKMPAVFKNAMDRNPTGRMGTPQEVADATVFLASPLSSFTTGTNFIVDGGITRRVNF